MPRFSVSVTDEQNAWVERQAAERDRSKSEIIRHLIDRQRQTDEDFTGVVNTGESPAVHGGEPAADPGEPVGPSTRELAAQLARVTERLDALEDAVTDDEVATPSEATDRDTAAAPSHAEPAGDDELATDAPAQSTDDEPSSPPEGGASTETTARSIPSPNEDGIIEAESRDPEQSDVGSTAASATGGDGDPGTAQSAPTPDANPKPDVDRATDADPASDSASSTDADQTEGDPSAAEATPASEPATGSERAVASEPVAESGGTWPTGDSHPDPGALEQTAYSDREDATNGRDASASGQATEDGDLVYAAQDDAAGADAVADEEAGGAETVASETDDDADEGAQAVPDEEAADSAADAEGPFAGMTGDADPADVEAALEDVIDEPALAESVFRCWEQLRDRGTAHRRIFKSHYEDIGDGYDSPDAWWRDVSDHFEMLPGVEAPAGGGNFYRYRYNR